MILHLANAEKFIFPFWEFSRTSIPGFDHRHALYVAGTDPRYRLPSGPNVVHADGTHPAAHFLWLIGKLNQAEKIIVHGLWDRRVLKLLAAQPWLLPRCHWGIWGGDLYYYLRASDDRLEPVRRFVIKRFGHLISHVRGDVELARKWYGARGEWHECFMYPSNLYRACPWDTPPKTRLGILLGNSGSRENAHEELLELLRPHSHREFTVYCPLSYGDASYARRIENSGRRLFGERFVPLTKFMELDEYLKILASVDIAMFGHRIQEAVGTTTSLIGMGKKVHMRQDVTSWSMFKEIGLTVYGLEEFSLDTIDPRVADENRSRVRSYFSIEQLSRQWTRIYG